MYANTAVAGAMKGASKAMAAMNKVFPFYPLFHSKFLLDMCILFLISCDPLVLDLYTHC